MNVPESGAAYREVRREALTGVSTGQPLSRERILLSGAAAFLFCGRQHASVRCRKYRCNPAWSETLACRYTLRPETGRSPA